MLENCLFSLVSEKSVTCACDLFGIIPTHGKLFKSDGKDEDTVLFDQLSLISINFAPRKMRKNKVIKEKNKSGQMKTCVKNKKKTVNYSN